MQRLVHLAESRQAGALTPCMPDESACILLFQHCLEMVKSPSTVKHYTSALISVYKQMGLDHTVSAACCVKNALVSIDNTVWHIPCPSLPMSLGILKKATSLLLHPPRGKTLATV